MIMCMLQFGIINIKKSSQLRELLIIQDNIS
jgi:hypothetical protein